MEHLKFDLIYKNDVGFHHKKYHISEIGVGLSKICDYHDIMEFVAFRQFSDVQDSNGKDIYEGDVVYLAGYGDYVAVFPFYDLYEAYMENNIGEIKGNIYENPELGA